MIYEGFKGKAFHMLFTLKNLVTVTTFSLFLTQPNWNIIGDISILFD